MEASTHSCLSLFTGGMTVLEVNVFSVNVQNVSVICTFQPGYTCTINYGTDPSYANLTYSDTNTTQNREATIVLSQDIQNDTTYYFIASAESSSQCERVRGTFRTGGYINSGVHYVMLQYFACTFVDFVNAYVIANRRSQQLNASIYGSGSFVGVVMTNNFTN